MGRALRRFQADTHMRRRLHEDRAQHGSQAPPHRMEDCIVRVSLDMASGRNGFGVYWANLYTPDGRSVCPCFYDVRAKARFKEQPKHCSAQCCGNQREWEGPTLQERRAQLIDEDHA